MQTLLYIILIVLNISGTALSWNPTLERVGYVRQYKSHTVEMPIPKHVNVSAYECRIGLPYGYKEFIGREVYFLANTGRMHGPWLVTDVEQQKHHYNKEVSMTENDLLADTDCKQYVHMTGTLLLAEYGTKKLPELLSQEVAMYGN